MVTVSPSISSTARPLQAHHSIAGDRRCPVAVTRRGAQTLSAHAFDGADSHNGRYWRHLGSRWVWLQQIVTGVIFWKKIARRLSQNLPEELEQAGSLSIFLKHDGPDAQKLGNRLSDCSTGIGSELAPESPNPPGAPSPARSSARLSSLSAIPEVASRSTPRLQTRGLETPDVALSQCTPRSLMSPASPTPSFYGASPRRHRLTRTGDMLMAHRLSTPRLAQLKCVLEQPQLRTRAHETMPSSRSTFESPSSNVSSPRPGPSRPALDAPRSNTIRSDSLRPETSFSFAIVADLALKPKLERTPLLTSINDISQAGGEENERALGSQNLAMQLDELRCREYRRGPWTRPSEPRRNSERQTAPEAEEGRTPSVSEVRPLERSSVYPICYASSKAEPPRVDFDPIVRLLDPMGKGSVSPDTFVPFMFWLGITRRRAAALMIFEFGFGRRDVSTASIMENNQFTLVQTRLVDGIQWMARRETTEQVCEYITDERRLTRWFRSMSLDPSGHVDIIDVMKFLANLDVDPATKEALDASLLFRFLTHSLEVLHPRPVRAASSEFERSEPLTPEMLAESLALSKFTFPLFCSLLCRCVVTWCIDRMAKLVAPPGSGLGMQPALSEEERGRQLRWTETHRRIAVSLLVNHRFWGREARVVLSTLSLPALATFGGQLSPEQWLLLFQRVRAQGLSSTLPGEGEEGDPDFLLKLAPIAPKGRQRTNVETAQMRRSVLPKIVTQ